MDIVKCHKPARVRDYWESGPALAGSILVFNTGRSMGQVGSIGHTFVVTGAWALTALPAGLVAWLGLLWRREQPHVLGPLSRLLMPCAVMCGDAGAPLCTIARPVGL